MTKEHCILCGVETPYDFETHVDVRIGYIEGIGQLCNNCYNQGHDRTHFTVSKRLIENTPNNQELGAKVRALYFESKK
jgi:hypothetical protein